MSKYPRHCARPVHQYSPTYHLSRTVGCVDCGVRLYKNHDFVMHGSRCSACWGEYMAVSNGVNERLFAVYVWKEVGLVEADVVVQVSAVSVDGAIERVMKENHLSFASYVWVVPEDEQEACGERFSVQCSVQVGT
jgi:hypothetical protein